MTAFPLAEFRINSAAYSRTSEFLADTAVWALIEEAELTPKPALVDQRGSGAHSDMSLVLLRLSARTLRRTFAELAQAAEKAFPDSRLRTALSAIGRQGEADMLRATSGCNTHRGAIWAVGLLCAAAATLGQAQWTPLAICSRAAEIACLPDLYVSEALSHGAVSHGAMAMERYGMRGARGEAEDGFSHAIRALAVLRSVRASTQSEVAARLDALLTIMTTLDDTCLVHRGGACALQAANDGARQALDAGGTATAEGMHALVHLDRELTAMNSSPGGSADLLSATLFLDRLSGDKQW